MRLEITDACSGHGRCYALAPHLFEDDEEGRGVVRNGGEIPSDMEQEAELTLLACPERAIRLSRTSP